LLEKGFEKGLQFFYFQWEKKLFSKKKKTLFKDKKYSKNLKKKKTLFKVELH
jgi:hypothetical protein